MEFTAKARYIRVSPQKAKLVLDTIKGRRVEDALATLEFTKKGVAPNIHKLLRSAVENANYLGQEKNLEVDVDNLYVKSAVANEGPRLKRIRPAPQGRAFRYQRRMSHLEITLAERHAVASVATVVGEDEDSGRLQPAGAVNPAKRAQKKAKVKAKAKTRNKAKDFALRGKRRG